MPEEHNEAVRVLVRVRPFNGRERAKCKEDDYPMSIVYMHPDQPKVDVLAEDGSIADSFVYGTTFWSIPEKQKQICSKPFADQEMVFNAMGAPAVESALEGYHTCIFAYGQTGSGKTYTMLGAPNDPGIAPRLVDRLFEKLEKANRRGWKYEVTLSFMEIYNEKVKDLLVEIGVSSPKDKKRKSTAKPSSPKGAKDYKDLKVRQSKLVGVYVDGLLRLGKEQGVTTAEKVKKVMKFGMEHRATAETKMNATSSRSHAIFQLCITATNTGKGITRYSHINIVDLAGSERITASGAQGATLVEATRINLSLTTLRRVIDALIQNSTSKNKVIPPYRDSLLTYILSESLGGNSNTMMLATISPSEMNREDTCNTLRYAMKAKSIVNTVRKNEQKSTVQVGHFAAEIAALRQQLIDDDPESAEYEDMKDELQRKEEEFQKHLDRAEDEKRMMEVRRESVAAALIKRKEIEKEMIDLDGVEDEKAIVDEEHKMAEQEMERVMTLQRKVSVSKKLADMKLEEQMRAKAELEEAKIVSVEKEAQLKTDVTLLNRKKFALAFNKAFVLGKNKISTDEIEAEVKQLTDATKEMEDQLHTATTEYETAKARQSAMESQIEYFRLKAEEMEMSTGVQERQAEADAIRKNNEECMSANNLLIEKVSELRIRISGMERSKTSQAERALTRISDTVRRIDTEKSKKQRLTDQLNLGQKEREDMKQELVYSKQNKSKALQDREDRALKREQRLADMEDIVMRNEALQLFLDNRMCVLEAQLKGLHGLHTQSQPLNDEMRFRSMVLQLGYGRVAINGGKPTRPVAFQSAATPSPRRSSEFTAPTIDSLGRLSN
eukprot:TRINITY_DN1429_c0_g2_i1.p1 TRINITY_DN1429_c0_g2~~TRINITY_DN1429_c0_g2_i1.p1  ORF type:complete len:837 (+),score=264.63 TRINITY_DN1429_c0_g2_i1:112-2622(+)